MASQLYGVWCRLQNRESTNTYMWNIYNILLPPANTQSKIYLHNLTTSSPPPCSNHGLVSAEVIYLDWQAPVPSSRVTQLPNARDKYWSLDYDHRQEILHTVLRTPSQSHALQGTISTWKFKITALWSEIHQNGHLMTHPYLCQRYQGIPPKVTTEAPSDLSQHLFPPVHSTHPQGHHSVLKKQPHNKNTIGKI